MKELEEDKLIREYWARKAIEDKINRETWFDTNRRINGCVVLGIVILCILILIVVIFGG